MPMQWQTGVMAGGAPSGESYDPTVYDPDFWDNPTDERIDKHVEGASAQAWGGDTIQGMQWGAAGGVWGMLIGAVAGTIVGIVDAVQVKDALGARLTEEREFREKLEAELAEVMAYRNNIVRHAEALLHPVEQSFRTRARAFGAQARAQGVTGAQAIAAQIQAENMYREQIGPALPGVMAAAEKEGQSRAMLGLAALEKKYDIDLSQQEAWFKQDLLAAQLKGQQVSGVIEGLTDMGMALGMGIEDLVKQNQNQQQQQQQSQNQQVGAGAGDGGGQMTQEQQDWWNQYSNTPDDGSDNPWASNTPYSDAQQEQAFLENL